MHDAEMYQAAIHTSVAAPATHRVLVLPGGAPPARLLELARCSTPRDARLELFTLSAGAHVPEEGTGALFRGGADEQADVSHVLRAIHETGADALVLGYPDHAAGRSGFTDIVERATAAASVDVVVCVDRHDRPWRRVMVPWLYGPLDDGALAVARRLARTGDAAVTILHVSDPGADDDEGLQSLSASVGGCTLKVVNASDPVVAAAVEARLGYDLIVLGGRGRVAHGRYFSMRQQRLLLTTDATLAIVHTGRQPD